MTPPKEKFSVPRGMRDFYPEDMAIRNHLFDSWRQASAHHGFEPYDAPVVETLDLLKRKSGEEIVHQIYAFKDKSGRDLALRPEMTPTLARMIAARQGALSFPIKWYTIAQCFRYERMTRGRKREHYQWNLDIIGEPSVSAEVEVIATAVQGLRLAGLQDGDYFVRYSSRRLLAELLDTLGIPPDLHAATFLALDKKDKTDDIGAQLVGESFTDAQWASVEKILNLESLDEAGELLPDDSESLAQLRQFTQSLSHYGLENIVRFDISVVRGLAYYTGIVFEAFDAKGEFRAIFGGGRYDDLLRDVGGKPETGVGLGFGDVVVCELLEALGRTGAGHTRVDVAVGYMSDAQRPAAMRIARELRNNPSAVDLALSSEKPKQFFSRVGGGHYKEAIYLGPDDVDSGKARMKDLETREEREISIP